MRQDAQIPVAHAALPFVFHNVVDVPCQGGGFLGSKFDPLQITVDPDRRVYSAGSLGLLDGQSPATLEDRRRLLGSLQEKSIVVPQTAPARDWQLASEKAYELIQSSSFHQSLDLGRESPETRDTATGTTSCPRP